MLALAWLGGVIWAIGATQSEWHDLGWPWLGWAAGAWRQTMCGVEVGAWAGAKMRLVHV